MDDSLEALLGKLSTQVHSLSGADNTEIVSKRCLLLPNYREGHQPQEHV